MPRLAWFCLLFVSIFPQLSVNEMESYSTWRMKHTSAEFQGRVYHKIFLYSETTCCVTLRGVMNETFSPPLFFFFCLFLLVAFSWQQCFWGTVLFKQHTLIFCALVSNSGRAGHAKMGSFSFSLHLLRVCFSSPEIGLPRCWCFVRLTSW